jgi:hypothetical protein
MTTSEFRKLVARIGAAARMSFPVRPHMLRHLFSSPLSSSQPVLGRGFALVEFRRIFEQVQDGDRDENHDCE